VGQPPLEKSVQEKKSSYVAGRLENPPPPPPPPPPLQ